jgi:hypothetical protein
VSGVKWIAQTLLDEAERELYNEEAILQQLDQLQERHRSEQIGTIEFEDLEATLLQRLLEARAFHQGRSLQ